MSSDLEVKILVIFSSGAIQFLSTMPFEAIKLQSVWVMINMILYQDKELPELLKKSGPDNIPSVRFLDVSPSEGIFLLTALSNMAISRTNPEDQKLIETIAVQILEVIPSKSMKYLIRKHFHTVSFFLIHKHLQ